MIVRVALLTVVCAGVTGGLTVSAAPQAVIPGATAASERAVLDAAIRRVYPALVRIAVVAAYYRDGREVKDESSGSGAIISPDGYVITNHHVAGRAKRLRCTLADKSEVEATLVGTDALSDIAVIKLDLSRRKGQTLPVAAFGDSDRLRVGDQVFAMGSPLALSQSVTLGIVSNLEMTFPRFMWPSTFKLDGEETGSLVRWIGHDAQISPGNSGGPLVDAQGQIIGINEISLGLSGAIPGNLAREVAEELIRHGAVRRSWVGLQLQPRLLAESQEGALIATVVPGSPAAAAGLRPGDVLVRYSGKPVDARYVEELPAVNRLLMSTPIGGKVEVTYRRDGKDARTTLTTVGRGTAQGEEAELKAWGATVRELTLLSAKELRREPQTGVLVSSLRPGSPASEAKPPLEAGDIVVSVGAAPVRTVDDLVKATEKAVGKETVAVPALVGFERRSERYLTVVHLGGKHERDRSADARKAWLPVSVQVLTSDLAEALGLKGRTGVRVTEVYAGTTAAAAGLKVGDILLELDGEAIPTSKPEDVEVFSALVRQYRVGTRVALAGQRAGAPLRVEVELSGSPKSSRELPEYRDDQFDFRARDLTFQDRVYFTMDAEQRGVIVTGVESGGWAALAQLAVADVVLQVDGEPVGSLATLETRMKTIAESRPARVVFFVKRGVQTLFLELEPAWDTRQAREAR